MTALQLVEHNLYVKVQKGYTKLNDQSHPSLTLHLISKAQKGKAKYTKSLNSSIGKATLNIVYIVVKMTVASYLPVTT